MTYPKHILAIWCQTFYQHSNTLYDLEGGGGWGGHGHPNQIGQCPNNISVLRPCMTLCDLEIMSRSQQYSCVSLVKIHQFLHEIRCRQAIFPNLSPPVTLKMGQGNQNLFSSCPWLNNIDVQVWSKSIHSFRRQGADNQFPTI